MKKYTFFLLLLLVAVVAFAAPAYRKPVKVRQSDGSVLTVVLNGDEAFHYHSTLDGKPLVKEPNGDFYYATFSAAGELLSTKCLAHDSANRSLYEKSVIASIDYDAMYVSMGKTAAARSMTYKAAAQKAGSQIVPEGDVDVAVVLVQFQDTKFTYSKEDIINILNKEGHVYENPFASTIGCARDYFIAQSDGKFRPNFMVTDIVTLDNNMAYYGGNDLSGEDKKPSYAVKEGIQKADATFDFSKCDNNGDGEVEFVYCIYAGYSESYGADANTIWPHAWSLSSQAGAVTVDGVMCNTYACSGELVRKESDEAKYGKVLAGIGLICHEFSHCLGLHDIYDTTYESGNWGMDYWDVMDQGNYAAEGYVPVGYSAYQRDFCGWRELEVIDSKGDYSMRPLTQDGTAYKVVNDANPNEYYILENRKQENWDKYLFGSGMLVVHVDYLKSAWDNNTINVTKNHPRYTLIPADNKLDRFQDVSNDVFVASLKGDVWPGTSGNTELTNTSLPAAKVYKGGFMNKPITDIQYKDDIISFNFMRGVFEGAPEVLPATDVSETSFVANWTALEGASEYYVELCKMEAADGDGDTEVLLSEDFLGLTKTNTDVSKTIGSYTSVSGWEGEKIYSEGGVLRVGTASNAGWLATPYLNTVGKATVEFSTALYNSADQGVVLTVAFRNNRAEVIASKNFSPEATMKTYSLSADVEGDFYIHFYTDYSSGKKRANLDNIVVSAEGSVKSELVANAVTSGTSYKFEGLEAGGQYKYRVQAKDGSGVSAFSGYMLVQTTTSIDDIVADGSMVEVYTLGGVKVYSGDKAGVQVPASGVYLLKSGSRTIKIRL